MDIDGIFIKFKTWPDQIICLRVRSPGLLKKLKFDYHQNNLFSFDWIILKLADKVDMDEVFNKFENCQDQIIYFRVTST